MNDRYRNTPHKPKALARLPFIALVTAPDSNTPLEYLEPLQTALHREGAVVLSADWNDTQIHWHPFDAAMLCFTWQNTPGSPAFRAWATRVSKLTNLLEPLYYERWEIGAPADAATTLDHLATPIPNSKTIQHRFTTPEALETSVATLLSRCTILPRHPRLPSNSGFRY
jgi:hypothetical protein